MKKKLWILFVVIGVALLFAGVAGWQQNTLLTRGTLICLECVGIG